MGIPAGLREQRAPLPKLFVLALPQPCVAARAHAERCRGRAARLVEGRACAWSVVMGRITSYNTVNKPCYNTVITGCIFA